MLRRLLTFIAASLVFSFVVAATPNPASAQACGTPPTPRLIIGGQGRVTPGLPNVVRSQPYRGPYSAILGEMPGGAVFTVINGPVCGEGFNWWYVNYNGLIGWTPEGEAYGAYWTEPVNAGSDLCAFAMPPRLVAGQNAYVIPGPSNRLRANPGLASPVIGQIPGGASLFVLAGPSCVDGIQWWQVTHNGRTGWTAEGRNGAYWLQSGAGIACNLPTRLAPSGFARVLPGLPNRIRHNPTVASAVFGLMPGGARFQINGMPVCAEGVWWYPVLFNGISGWTMEGQNGQYYIEPSA